MLSQNILNNFLLKNFPSTISNFFLSQFLQPISFSVFSDFIVWNMNRNWSHSHIFLKLLTSDEIILHNIIYISTYHISLFLLEIKEWLWETKEFSGVIGGLRRDYHSWKSGELSARLAWRSWRLRRLGIWTLMNFAAQVLDDCWECIELDKDMIYSWRRVCSLIVLYLDECFH